jgi:hypothetical protein
VPRLTSKAVSFSLAVATLSIAAPTRRACAQADPRFDAIASLTEAKMK